MNQKDCVQLATRARAMDNQIDLLREAIEVANNQFGRPVPPRNLIFLWDALSQAATSWAPVPSLIGGAGRLQGKVRNFSLNWAGRWRCPVRVCLLDLRNGQEGRLLM